MGNRIQKTWQLAGTFLPALGLFFVIFVDTKWFLILIDWLLGQAWVPTLVRDHFLGLSRHSWVYEFSSPLRGILLLGSLAALAYVILTDLDLQAFRAQTQPEWKSTLVVFVLLGFLFFPGSLTGWAREYAETSQVLFTKLDEINNKSRFLMPALANLLFFRGMLFYTFFSLVCTFLLLHATAMWFASCGIELPIWQFLSLGTLSFISFNFYFPGYPDVLVCLFLLLALSLPVGERGFLAFFSLSLATHEASLFIWGVLVLFRYPPRTWVKFLAIAVMYFLLRLASYGFEFSMAFVPQMVGDSTPLEWLAQQPGREALGLFFAFKLMWLVVLSALIVLFKQKRQREALLVCGLIVSAAIVTLLGIDTSRLAGWAFPAVLLSFKVLAEVGQGWGRKLLNGVGWANLILPSFYASLNIVTIPAGLYALVAGLLGG